MVWSQNYIGSAVYRTDSKLLEEFPHCDIKFMPENEKFSKAVLLVCKTWHEFQITYQCLSPELFTVSDTHILPC